MAISLYGVMAFYVWLWEGIFGNSPFGFQEETTEEDPLADYDNDDED